MRHDEHNQQVDFSLMTQEINMFRVCFKQTDQNTILLTHPKITNVSHSGHAC